MSETTTRAIRRIVTVTGADRPGLVAAVSQVLAEEGVDLEDISMTRLSSNFATMLLARGGDEARLQTRLNDIASKFDLNITLQPAVEQGENVEPDVYVSAAGPNRTGIVAALSEVLARHEANILEMATRLLDRTQVPVYLVRIEAAAGPGGVQSLRDDLERVGKELQIEVRLEAVEHTDL